MSLVAKARQRTKEGTPGVLYKADRADHRPTQAQPLNQDPHLPPYFLITLHVHPRLILLTVRNPHLYSSSWTDVSFSYPPSTTHDVALTGSYWISMCSGLRALFILCSIIHLLSIEAKHTCQSCYPSHHVNYCLGTLCMEVHAYATHPAKRRLYVTGLNHQ